MARPLLPLDPVVSGCVGRDETWGRVLGEGRGVNGFERVGCVPSLGGALKYIEDVAVAVFRRFKDFYLLDRLGREILN